jgi:hypothetical protein
MLCRNEQRGQQAVQQVRELTGNQDVHLEVGPGLGLGAGAGR